MNSLSITSTVVVAAIVPLLSGGCSGEVEEVDPVTRAAIYGCIEIAEDGFYPNSERAVRLEQAGCGRYSKRDIAAVVPEYRAEQAREARLADLQSRWFGLNLQSQVEACQGLSDFPLEWCSTAKASWDERRQRREAFIRPCLETATSRGSSDADAASQCSDAFDQAQKAELEKLRAELKQLMKR